MNPKIREKTMEAFASVLPITIIVLVLSIVLVPVELGTFVMFLAGAVMLIVGMGFFQLGAEMAMTPLGEGIGVMISKSRNTVIAVVTSYIMGTIITLAEPDLQVLANQVPSIPNRILIWAVAVGMGSLFSVAVVRISKRIKLSNILFILYAIVIVLSFFVPSEFLAVSFDAGGVTTGPITVPFIMAMGVGMASIRSDKNASDDSFGLVAISSVGPIIAVLILGIFYKPTGSEYASTELSSAVTTQDAAKEFLFAIPEYIREVFISILPILGMFVVFQFISHRYRRTQIKRILVGFVYTFIGLVLFLTGVNVGFSQVGTVIGRDLASSDMKWLLIPVGMLIGYYIVKAEPAIQILNKQVSDVTNGVVSAKLMNTCMSIGVSVSVGLSMLRVILGIPIQYILIPGYIIAIVLSRFVPDIFVGIAFDSGGVASGPMTSTFLLPLSIGACEALGGNIMTDAFGVVALVALTPLIAVQLMGLSYKLKQKKAERAAIAITESDIIKDFDEIVDFEEVGKDGE
ncbi:MAG: DUF1538 domain-containing protein [Oscillospiraceae bacterium]|nr:DUF1538 domain-containing protein [Oscillospiraceae bacterium]